MDFRREKTSNSGDSSDGEPRPTVDGADRDDQLVRGDEAVRIGEHADEYGAARWCGPIQLQDGRSGLLLTFERGLTLLLVDDQQLRAVSVPARDIIGLKPRRKSIEIDLMGHEHIVRKGTLVVRGASSELFEALVGIARMSPSKAVPTDQPSILPRQRPAPMTPPRRSPAEPQRRASAPSRGAGVAANRTASARLATAFAPTAYAEHGDGVLRPCTWTTADVPPQAGAALLLTRDGEGWSAALDTRERS